MKIKPILVLDFDGVLHSYKSGWQGADNIPDEPVPGAQAFCGKALQVFEVWIISSRCASEGGSEAILDWLNKWQFPRGIVVSPNGVKPPAFVTLDDRAVTFHGAWPSIKRLLDFKPWYKRNG